MSYEPGDKNRNAQILVRKTGERGNHPFARAWVLRCTDRSHGHAGPLEYEANSCDFHIRGCPKSGPKVASRIN